MTASLSHPRKMLHAGEVSLLWLGMSAQVIHGIACSARAVTRCAPSSKLLNRESLRMFGQRASVSPTRLSSNEGKGCDRRARCGRFSVFQLSSRENDARAALLDAQRERMWEQARLRPVSLSQVR